MQETHNDVALTPVSLGDATSKDASAFATASQGKKLIKQYKQSSQATILPLTIQTRKILLLPPIDGSDKITSGYVCHSQDFLLN
ncbi:MAG: hypothetical protein JSC189_000187 [Candidatus Tokpelaia sp. JSC189]|nr:MAG: hypothetical protein JSC189_000187 [Candidatus Tokpelaia sp. JSC189]